MEYAIHAESYYTVGNSREVSGYLKLLNSESTYVYEGITVLT